MANKVSFIIQLQNRFSRKAEQIRRAVGGMVGGFSKLDRKIKKTGIKLARLGKQAKAAGGKLTELGKKLTTRISLPLAAFGTVALVQSAKLETLATSFETMTGSAEKGQKLLSKLVQFTATTPFQLEGVAKATKTLLAFKVPLNDMLPTLRMLGDIAAGTDAPLSDIAQIFGKARAKGKLMTEELLQLAERGIPIIDLLADKFNLSKAEIFKLASQSKISFKVMEDALGDMTSKGGIFFNQTKRQSATLAGLFSTLKDNITLTSGVFGDIIVDVFGLKDGLGGLSEFFNELRTDIRNFAKEQPGITKLIAVIVGLVAIVGPVLVVVGQIFVAFGALTFASGVLGISFSAMIIPVLSVIVAIGLLITAGVLIVKNWDDIKEGARLLWRDVSGFFSNLWGDIKTGALGLVSSFAGFFDGIITSAVSFGSDLIDTVMAPINFLTNKISGLGSSISNVGTEIASFFSFGETEIKSSQSVTQKSQTDINVNLRAPAGIIESVKSKTIGNRAGLNTGVNMVATQ